MIVMGIVIGHSISFLIDAKFPMYSIKQYYHSVKVLFICTLNFCVNIPTFNLTNNETIVYSYVKSKIGQIWA
jgi:hypothetical protein